MFYHAKGDRYTYSTLSIFYHYTFDVSRENRDVFKAAGKLGARVSVDRITISVDLPVSPAYIYSWFILCLIQSPPRNWLLPFGTSENVGVVTDWSMNFRLTNAIQAKPHVSRKQTVIWFRIAYPRIPRDIHSRAVNNNTASMYRVQRKGRVLNTKFWLLCMYVCAYMCVCMWWVRNWLELVDLSSAHFAHIWNIVAWTFESIMSKNEREFRVKKFDSYIYLLIYLAYTKSDSC